MWLSELAVSSVLRASSGCEGEDNGSDGVAAIILTSKKECRGRQPFAGARGVFAFSFSLCRLRQQ
jgi:hypothetical protein